VLFHPRLGADAVVVKVAENEIAGTITKRTVVLLIRLNSM
jgi:hypothetical protein